MGSAYVKEALTVKCEAVVETAEEMLDWDRSEETLGNLTSGERACLEALVPQLKIAAELFRQCSKNKETP